MSDLRADLTKHLHAINMELAEQWASAVGEGNEQWAMQVEVMQRSLGWVIELAELLTADREQLLADVDNVINDSGLISRNEDGRDLGWREVLAEQWESARRLAAFARRVLEGT